MVEILLGALLGFAVYHRSYVEKARELNRSTYQSGYFRGRTDELWVNAIRIRCLMQGALFPESEMAQMAAQQVTENDKLDLPEGWQWDGIDRVALYG